MKKSFSLIIAAILCALICIVTVGCGGTLKQIKNDFGAILEGGDFPKGSTLVTEVIDAGSDQAKDIIDIIAEEAYDRDGNISIFDIHVSKGSKEIQPNGKVKITLPAPFESDSYITFHIKDDNSVEKLETGYENGKISFETDSFSAFVITEEEKEIAHKFTVGQNGTGGYVSIVGKDITVNESNNYTTMLKPYESITIKAMVSDEYRFVGWFEPVNSTTPVILKDTPLSTDVEYTFEMLTSDFAIYAVFRAEITSLILDGDDAGFTDGEALFTLGGSVKPAPELVLVSGKTKTNTLIPLVKDVDYTIDLGGLDFSSVGEFTITYTYKFDSSINATLKVYVVSPMHDFSAFVDGGNGMIYHNSIAQESGYQAQLMETETVTLSAVPNEYYDFDGWYINGELISYNTEYTFTMGTSDMTVYAKFTDKVYYLWSDCIPGGFDENTREAVYTIGDATLPNPDLVLVYARIIGEDILLTKDIDYTIDYGNLDFNVEGRYLITYTYIKNPNLYTELWVVVNAPIEPIEINLTYNGTANPVKYNGGRAAYVFKNSILNNGEECDIQALGLFYEWRNHETGEVVKVNRDDTWDDSLHYPSPAVPGVYDFVVYSKEDDVKTDLLTVEREIVENQFSLVDELSMSEYTLYTVIAKVGDDYYAMGNPFDGNCEREAIKVTPNASGVISLGSNYEFVFRFYDSGKRDDDGILYSVRIGNGPYRKGNLILWSTGGIEYTTSTSADYTLKASLNPDGSAYIHNPFCGGTLRLVYDSVSGKYMFTAKKEGDDTRDSYPVYLYSEYEEIEESTEVYEFNSKLTKEYDGTAVSFNIYKDVNICTGNGEDAQTAIKNGTGRFVWTDLKGNIISVGVLDEDGNVTGPSEIGSYILVFQTYQKGEGGMEWSNKAQLHYFEITDSSEVI